MGSQREGPYPFPSVLANMDNNIAWTSELGDAYVYQQQDVVNAIQVMRQKAQVAGALTSNAAQKVTTKDQIIIVEPADLEVVGLRFLDGVRRSIWECKSN
jgi:hypothetical protein